MTQYVQHPGVDRPHTVYRLTDRIFKVVQFFGERDRFGPGPVEEQKHHDKKLDSSLSRTRRVILEKALCNPWEWFCTLTIAEDKYDRSDLVAWRDSFTQWLRDQRKKGYKIKYLIVPERHKDGSWHAHGFLTGIPENELISFREMDKRGYRTAEGRRLPAKLRRSNYRNWPAYQQKFGFCSLGKIKNPVAAGFYITKYITKENECMVQDVGLHSYFSSKPLLGPEKFVEFTGRHPEVDRLLVNQYDFCATGMTHLKDDMDWEAAFLDLASWFEWLQVCTETLDFNALAPLDPDEKSAPELEADEYYEFEQLVLKM